jgi:inhibitor of cysteine peptidase
VATTTLTAADDGATVDVGPGDEVVVELAENATTGFRWHVERLDGPATLESDGYAPAGSPVRAPGQAPPPSDAVVGAGGTRQFRVRIDGPGTVELVLRLWREWAGDESVIERCRVTLQSTAST